MTIKEEDLIKLAVIDIKPALENDVDEVDRFILVTELKSGRTHVSAKELYGFYCSWSLKPIPMNIFLRKFTKSFTKYSRQGYKFYLLNKKAWEIDFLLRKLMKSYGKITEEEPKDSSSIPRTNKKLQLED